MAKNEPKMTPEFGAWAAASYSEVTTVADLEAVIRERVGGLETYRVADADLNGPTDAWPWTHTRDGSFQLAAIDEALWGLFQLFQPSVSIVSPGGVNWDRPFEEGFPPEQIGGLRSWVRALVCLVSRGHREAFRRFAPR